jgi:predicted permease
MPWLRRLLARLRYRHFQDDVARELEHHRTLKEAELMGAGASPADARHQSSRALGNVTLAREDARSVWIAPWLEGIWQDLRFALRSMRRRPVFAAAVILILALGSGLVTTVFSLGYGAFLRPWPVPDPNSIVLLYARAASISVAEFRYLDGRSHAFQQLAFMDRLRDEPVIYRDADLGRVSALYVSRGYVDLIRTDFVAGRGFAPDEHDYLRPAAVAVLGRRIWQHAFGSDPSVVGQVIQLGQRKFTIVGVAGAPTFVEMYRDNFDIALPLAAQALAGTDDARRRFTDPEQRRSSDTIAIAELSALSRQFRDEHKLAPIEVQYVTTRRVSWPSGRPEWPATRIAFLGFLLIHLLACANAGNLLLARGLARQREIAIRQALGAGRARIVRQLLVETILLSAAAGGLALLVVWLVPPMVASRLPVFAEGKYTVVFPVLGFSVALAVVTAMVTGLAPALRSSSRSNGIAPASQGPPPRALRLRRALLSAQVAFATTLLVGAGLLGRSIARAAAVDPGFAIHEIAVIEPRLPRLSDPKGYAAFYRDLQTALAAPGLPSIAYAVNAPLADNHTVAPVRRLDEAPGEARPFRRMDVSENYFDVMGIRLEAGRAPSARTPDEAVVSVRAARQLWPSGENPIGQSLRHGWFGTDFGVLTVVGVAPDVAIEGMVERVPSVYLSAGAHGQRLLVRDTSPAAVARVQAAANAILPGVTVTSHPLSDHIRQSLAASITGSRVAWGVSALGLLLATIGAFGVFAYAVEERRREIGIRLALGAGLTDVISTVWTTAQRAMIVGVTVGLVLAMGGAQLLRSFLHGLSPFDPIAYLQIAAILFGSAALATWIPARRAARVDPAVTLRTE